MSYSIPIDLPYIMDGATAPRMEKEEQIEVISPGFGFLHYPRKKRRIMRLNKNKENNISEQMKTLVGFMKLLLESSDPSKNI
jgi:hypothetical protein